MKTKMLILNLLKVFKNYIHLIILGFPLIPILGLYRQYPWTKATYENLIHVSGEFSIRLLILTLLITPLLTLFPQSKFWKWMRRYRREFGLASFFYLVVHLSAYLLHLPSTTQMLKEFYQSTYFAGWMAFVIMVVLALTSHPYFIRKLEFIYWKNIQRSVYLVAFLSAMHWLLKEKFEPVPVLIHFMPLVILELIRVKKGIDKKRRPGLS